MPAIETLPFVQSPTDGPATPATNKIIATGDEFEQAMTDALAPAGKKSEAGVKPKLGFLTAVKRPLVQSGPPTASPKTLLTEQTAGEKTASVVETGKLATPSAKPEKAVETLPALLIPSLEAARVPMISFSLPAPENIFVAAAPTPVTGGKSATPSTATVLTGVAARATAQKVSSEISAPPSVAVKPADLMSAPSAPTSEILTPISGSVATPITLPANTQTVAATAVAKDAAVASPQNFASSSTVIIKPQPRPEPMGTASQTPAPALENLASDSAAAVPLNLPLAMDVWATTPPAENISAPEIVVNDPQKIPVPASPVIPASARKEEPVRANRDAAVLANMQINAQPEKNPAVVLLPTAAEVTGRVEALPVPLMNLEAEPKMDSGVLPGQITARGEPRAADSVVAAAVAVNTGTGVASTLPAMKKSDKVEFFAGPTGQKLPVAGPTRMVAEAMASALSELPPRRSELFSTEFSAPFTGSGTANNVTATTSAPPVSVASLPALSEARLQTVERTHDLVSVHALRLVESKSDAMSVVLKPGAGTELSLELRQRDGVVEAQAFLSVGDHQFLNQHWADLQARLELRGVKLGPLGGETSFTSGGNFSQQRSPSRDEETERAAAFAEFAAVSGGATARSAAGAWGWESWA